MLVYKIVLIIFSALVGAAMGSFACCQAWRIRLKEEKKKDPGKRSVCLSCGVKLKWHDNIPILSWLILRGKCRKCGAKIGKAEICAEFLGLLSFGFIAWRFASIIPVEVKNVAEFIGALDLARMVAVMAAMVGLILLAVYDAKWQEMPVGILVYAIIMGAAYAGIGLVQGSVEVFSVIGSVALLAGVYYLLYFFSKEKLVGGGDWLLCLAIGLLLADWRLALVELFLSNTLGSFVMLGAKKKKTAFGPFLVIAFVVIFAAQEWLLSTLMIGN